MPSEKSASSTGTFRVGRVTVYARGKTYYLRYFENGKRLQVRGSSNKQAARQLAAQVNAQLETGVPAATSFEPISIDQLRQRWLAYHEQVKQSSVSTVARYRTATLHLVQFVETQGNRLKMASNLTPTMVEAFALWLRTIEVAPNGHQNTAKRKLMDKGVTFILETCRSLFSYAIKHRHLPPYHDNPFAALAIDSMVIENAKPIVLLNLDQERRFLAACDEWEYPLFLTLMLTGMRPGEVTHLLLDDIDVGAGVIRVTNKAELGWKIKTRSERSMPLHPVLAEVLKELIGTRTTGPLFPQRRCASGFVPALAGMAIMQLNRLATERAAVRQPGSEASTASSRREVQRLRRSIWRDLASIDEDDVRIAFMRIGRRIGLENQTAPKVLRHGFATMLQDANVDPLIRNLLMGHSTASAGSSVVRPAGLGMTGVYTHSREDTIRQQLFHAIDVHGLVANQAGMPRRSLSTPTTGAISA